MRTGLILPRSGVPIPHLDLGNVCELHFDPGKRHLGRQRMIRLDVLRDPIVYVSMAGWRCV